MRFAYGTLLSYYYRRLLFLFSGKLREREDQGFSTIVDFVDCDKIPT